jgi:hypothetical protein
MSNKSPKALPGVPQVFNNLDEITLYLRNLVRELNDQHTRTLEGPLNKDPITVEQYDDFRNINAATITHADLADFVATLVKVLQKGGVLK